MSVAAETRLEVALARARDHLLSLQDAEGWWKGELETNVTIDSEDLFLRHYLGILEPRATEATARWIRSKQRDDGSWATFFGGPPDVSTTVEAYVALRLAGDEADAEHMQRAAAYVRGAGGMEATRVFTRMWLSLLSLWSWHDVPVIPPEQIMLPAWAPLRERAGTPSWPSAIATSGAVIVSPLATSMSSSRGGGSALTRRARSIRRSVVWPMAETTATTCSPALTRSAIRLATRRMRAAVPTLVPPYFWTINVSSP